MVNIPHARLSLWRNFKCSPSLKRVLDLCYALDISPVELMNTDLASLQEAMQARRISRPARPKPPAPHRVDKEQALELIRAVLDGREAPLPIRQAERRLGLGARTLVYHFPHECALLATQYQAERAERARKRIAQDADEIRQVTLTLHAQKVSPNEEQVRATLSNPNVMARPEIRAIWHATRQELGLESRDKEGR